MSEADTIGTLGGKIRIPRVIVLVAFDRLPRRHVRFSRINIMTRDRFQCQYCGDRPSRQELNLDHVVPRALGGRTTWENVVTSCVDCNRRKGGRTPVQAHMVLIRRPGAAALDAARPSDAHGRPPRRVAAVPERRRCLVLERRAAGVAREVSTLLRDPHTATPHARRASAPYVVALGGGKGGVGKTFLAANISAELARLGYRVAAVDTDLEGANLHTWLGVPRPATSLADFVAGRENDVDKLLIDTPVENLALISATQGHLTSAHPEGARRVDLLQGLRRLDRDVVVIDCGAGIHPAVIDYFLLGDDGILVLHPEPTSLENAYSFLRAVFYRRMHLAMLSHTVQERIQESLDQRNERGIRTPQDLLREVQATRLRGRAALRRDDARDAPEDRRERGDDRRGREARLRGAERVQELLRSRGRLRGLREPRRGGAPLARAAAAARRRRAAQRRGGLPEAHRAQARRVDRRRKRKVR